MAPYKGFIVSKELVTLITDNEGFPREKLPKKFLCRTRGVIGDRMIGMLATLARRYRIAFKKSEAIVMREGMFIGEVAVLIGQRIALGGEDRHRAQTLRKLDKEFLGWIHGNGDRIDFFDGPIRSLVREENDTVTLICSRPEPIIVDKSWVRATVVEDPLDELDPEDNLDELL